MANRIGRAESGLFPTHRAERSWLRDTLTGNALLRPALVGKKQASTVGDAHRFLHWTLRKTSPLHLTKASNAETLLVCLEAAHEGGPDIDVYFDDVRIEWEIEDIPQD